MSGEIDTLPVKFVEVGCEILTEKPPYVGDDSQALLRRARRADLEDAFARLNGCGADGDLIDLAHRCLAPDPDSRWHAAADLKLELEWIAKRAASSEVPKDRSHRWTWIAGALTILVLGIVAWNLLRPPAATDAASRLTLSFEGLIGEGNPPAPSPDGQYFVFMAFDASGNRSLWIRSRNSPNARQIPGVRAYPIRFKPSAGNFAKVSVEGVRWVVTNRELFDAVRLGLEVAAALQELYPGKISFAANRKLIGSEAVLHALEAGEDPRAIEQKIERPLRDFLGIREKYLLYR